MIRYRTSMKDSAMTKKTETDVATPQPDVTLPLVASAMVDFSRLGLNQVAYVRQAMVNDMPMWSIHAATGDTLGSAETFAQAWVAVKQNNLEPLWVH
ncbi:MAG: hypothetical protein CK529_01680 [Rhodospirillaceae bacterium]|nr:MAG: hypothetical protein CK529_01680 [Rhodospirillaceae bacterium]